MAEVDPKVAQRAFKDFQRGHHVPDIIQRHGLTTREFNQTVKFETAVNARVKAALVKQQAKEVKPPVKPALKGPLQARHKPLAKNPVKGSREKK